jgi:hypothetical protein
MTKARIALALLALLALAACSEHDRTVAGPSSAFPPTGATGSSSGGSSSTGSSSGGSSSTGPSGASGALPPASPGAGTGDLASGWVSVEVSGDLDAHRTLRELVTATYAPPPGSLAIVWTAGGGDATTVGIGGVSFSGTRPTAPSLALPITLETDEGISTFISMSGECEITIDVATQTKLAGRFRCTRLAAGDGSLVDASATFRATE